jgi:hypothetical protein
LLGVLLGVFIDKQYPGIGTLAVEEVFSIARKTLAELADVNLEERMTEVFVHRLHDMNDKQIEELKATLDPSKRPVLVRTAFELGSPQKTAIEGGVKAILGEGTGIEHVRLWSGSFKWRVQRREMADAQKFMSFIPGRRRARAFIREYLFISLSLFKACAESLASENASRLAAMQRARRRISIRY